METKKAIDILLSLLNKKTLNTSEKEAVLAAIGALDCARLAENRTKKMIEAQKTKRHKSFE